MSEKIQPIHTERDACVYTRVPEMWSYPKVNAHLPQHVAYIPVTRPDIPMDISSRFGGRLRDLRRARKLTQLQMAIQFGIDRSYISDIERGRKSVSLPTLEVIAIGMSVSLSDLLQGM